jgi:peptidoglycan/LPS O-acetylase OafA/YrhL
LLGASIIQKAGGASNGGGREQSMTSYISGQRHRSIGYRPDIDGLRALAILPVCFFHSGSMIFPGGFVGVDIFFVISGYLMASVIGQGLLEGNFSYIEFYEWRIRRIVPALVGVLAFCVIAAIIMAPPKLFQDFGQTLLWTVLSASNVLFFSRSANYFDVPTSFNPLLHTWSLGVEEQFYFLFPICLGVLWRLSAHKRLAAMVALTMISFALSVWGTANAPTATFYLLPTRLWELMIGGLLALLAHAFPNFRVDSKINELACSIGIVLIAWSVVQFGPDTAFPGVAAVVPCLGAALLIQFGRDGRAWATKLLSLSPFRFIGAVSYSLYLWHWPLIVFGQKYLLLAFANTSLILVPAVIVAYFSWRWIEQPFRFGRAAINSGTIYGFAGTTTLSLAFAGVLIASSDGWPARFPGIASVSMAQQLADESKDSAWRTLREKCFVFDVSEWGQDQCFLTRDSISNGVLWGDSFAASWAHGFFRNPSSQLNVLQYTSPQCPPILYYEAASRPQCTPFNASIISIIQEYKIKVAILVANWESYLRRKKLRFESMYDTVRALRRLGVRVVLIGQSPVFAFPYPDEYFFKTFGTGMTNREYLAPVDVDADINAILGKAAQADIFFDPMWVFCPTSAGCIFKVGSEYLFRDNGHFTNVGSDKATRELLAMLHGASFQRAVPMQAWWRSPTR